VLVILRNHQVSWAQVLVILKKYCL